MEPSTRKLSSSSYAVEHDTKYVSVHNENHDFLVEDSYVDLVGRIYPEDGKYFSEEVDLGIDLVSDQVKILIKVEDSFYHFFIDSLTLILKIHEEFPERLLVLYLQTARPSKTGKALIEMLLGILDREKVNYTTINYELKEEHAPICKVNNFALAHPYFSANNVTTFQDVIRTAKIVVEHCKEVLGVSGDPVPFRRVYLARGKEAGNHVGIVPEDYQFYKNDDRMDDFENLERFFESIGYEIIDPEKDFESMHHQIVYMSEVKTLVSVTSSGLANMIFMSPRQKIVELQAEIVQSDRASNEEIVIPRQGIHTMYQGLAFMKEHLLISVPSRRDSNRVIEILSSPEISYVL